MIPVSIIIPVYITEEIQKGWLVDCIESAISNNSSEIIVVDDSSPVDICGIRNKFDDVVWYRLKENRGSSAARNVAVSLATNSLIFPLDCDDMLVDGALEKLYKLWEGVPLYSDIRICNPISGKDKVHNLMDFSCHDLTTQCGLSSVNVLHSVRQWRHVGGWKEDIRYLEDAEYNTRLMYIYCGRRVREPLVIYREHSYQKTVRNKKSGAHQRMLRKVSDMIRSIDFMAGCCGGKPTRSVKSTSNPRNVQGGPQAVHKKTIPGEVEELVKVRYTGGKGKGKHYYRGLATGHGYKVQHGSIIYADPRDVAPYNSFFERVTEPEKSSPKDAVEVEKKEERTPRVDEDISKQPVVDDDGYPDLPNINYREVMAILGEMDLTPEDAENLYEIEKNGRDRKRVKAYLKRRM